ncbi:uncharacterized protein LOC134266853 [Saccostrea cucullata]|uniref:uncharacterized protein LOC134266853 n=1 Tax=Saccostrea cuccullata TaxID=36930 RepID=UPI002ED045C2
MLRNIFLLVAAMAVASAQNRQMLDRNGIYGPSNGRDQTGRMSYSDSMDMNNQRDVGNNQRLDRQFNQNGLSTMGSRNLRNGLLSSSSSDAYDLDGMNRQDMTSGRFDTLRGDRRMTSLGSDFDMANGLSRGKRFLDSTMRSNRFTNGNDRFMQDYDRRMPNGRNSMFSERDGMDFSRSNSQYSPILDSFRRSPSYLREMESYNMNRRYQNGDGRIYNDLTGFPRRNSEADGMSTNFMDNFDSTNSFPGMSMEGLTSELGDNMGMMRSFGSTRGQGRRLGRTNSRRLGRRYENSNTGSRGTI